MMYSSRGLMKFYSNLFSYYSSKTTAAIRNKHIDKSLVPVLNEKDLVEQFISGGGPGGSNVNKSTNCVQLTHKPTGITVKVHKSRLLQENQKLARELLTSKLDNLINGEKSVENQIKAIELRKSRTRESKRKRLQALREKWEESNLKT